MERIQHHFVVCLITGLVTILPIGGTILLIILAERSLSPLIPDKFYFPGEGLLLVIALLPSGSDADIRRRTLGLEYA
jgi:hypothetical protein